MSEVTLVTVPAVTIRALRREVAFDAEHSGVEGVFDAYIAVLQAAGIRYAAPETALYRFPSRGVMEVTVGAPIDQEVPGLGVYHAPEARALKTVHCGPMEDLPSAFKRLSAEVAARGLTAGEYGREVYRLITTNNEKNEVDVYMDVVEGKAKDYV